MLKSRVSLECFWELKISKYVEKLVHVFNEYLRSHVLLSLTSVAGWISHVSLAYVIPCLNTIACLGYIYSMHAFITRAWHDRSVLRCQVHICGWSIEVGHFRLLASRSLEFIPMIEASNAKYINVHTMLMTFYRMRDLLFSYWGCGHVFQTIYDKFPTIQ